VRPSVGYVIASYGTPELASRAAASINEVAARGSGVLPVAVVYDREGQGYSATLNRGIKRLQPMELDVICCLNADVLMLPSNDAVLQADEVVLDFFAEDPTIAIVGPRQVDEDKRIVHGGIVPNGDDGTLWDLHLHHRYWQYPVEDEGVDYWTHFTQHVPMVSGSVFYVRRDWLESVGGWPEWTRFYYEDMWLCYLARHQGYGVVYTGACTWEHLHEQGSPLGRGERVDRLELARLRFVYECGKAGIPLRINEPQ
jgi:GT2 family glycosyltransferase